MDNRRSILQEKFENQRIKAKSIFEGEGKADRPQEMKKKKLFNQQGHQFY